MNNMTLAETVMDALKLVQVSYQPKISATVNAATSKGALLPLVSAVFLLYLIFLSNPSSVKLNAPIVGYRSLFEPTQLLRLRFLFGARDIIRNGYAKVG